MNILTPGGTGFVGRKLTHALLEKGHHVYILTRSPEKHVNTSQITYYDYEQPAESFPAIHGVVNLAGESLFGYWSKQKKEAILTSRIETTEKEIDLIKQLHNKPDVLINGAAIGYYGVSVEIGFTVKTTKPGDELSARLM